MSDILTQFRAKHPQYNEVDDAKLADGIYNKYYADKIGRDEFNAKIGARPPQPQGIAAPVAPVQPTPQRQAMPWSGNILPVSGDEATGEWNLDWNAGIPGAIKRAVTLPGEVMKGEVDINAPEAVGRTLEAAFVASPIGAAARVPGSIFAPKSAYKTVTPPAPTREALKEATDAGYTQARGLGAEYTPQAIKSWADETATALDAQGRIAENFPKVHSLINKLRDIPDDAVSINLESIDALYRRLGELGADASEGKVASIVQRSLDDFHDALGPEGLVAGTATPQEAANILRTARGNAAAGFRSDRITGLEQTTARRSASANSGRNTDNTIRQRLTSLIESAKGSRGLSKAEEDAIDDIIFGRPTKNAARYVGNLLGGGMGLGSTVLGGMGAAGGYASGGEAMGVALGAMLPGAIGVGARNIANRMSQSELKALDAMIRSRSPLAGATPPYQMYAPSATQEALLKALMARGASDDNNMQSALGAR